MRILHSADWHLGKQLHGTSLLEDQAYVLEEFIQLVLEERPDCVIVAGDIYDRSIPPVDAVSLLDTTISRLAKDCGCPLIIIAGNHDSPDRLGFGAELMAQSGVYISGSISPRSRPIFLEDNYGPVAICPLPYLEPAIARQQLADPLLRSQSDALHAGCELFRQSLNGRRSILVAHAFVQGGIESESERPLSVGGSAAVPIQVFDGFDYVALGHLHRPQSFDGGRVRYAGSLLKYSFSEISHRKSHSMIEIGRTGEVSLTEIPISPLRELRELRGEFKSIMCGETDSGNRDDYLVIELTNTEAMLDVMGQLRSVFPNVLHVRKADPGTSGLSERSIGTPGKGDLELFGDFYRYVQDRNLNPDQLEYLKSSLEELNCLSGDED